MAAQAVFHDGSRTGGRGSEAIGPGVTAGLTVRAAILATADLPLRQRLAQELAALRWQIHPAAGGAEVLACMARESAAHSRPAGGPGTVVPGTATPGTVIVDSWLPDLEVREFVRELCRMYPHIDVFAIDGTDLGAPSARGPFRQEVLYALRRAEETPDQGSALADGDRAAWAGAPSAASLLRAAAARGRERGQEHERGGEEDRVASVGLLPSADAHRPGTAEIPSVGTGRAGSVRDATARPAGRLAEFIGESPAMLEVSRRIRLVAPRTTPVLIQGATGTGKELVARALHRMSPRSAKPFVALNCAAIPEALLESELFGHARGAFTGAVQARAGRIEAAQGGTLFLDEIGELPLALQAKLLRFVECGELQRVGESEAVRVDVRILAATHRHLGRMARSGAFRADLFYRLSVFLIRTPCLSEHIDDLPGLVDHLLWKMGKAEPAKALSEAALQRLFAHSFPGNVRELEHVLERAWILAEERPSIEAEEIEFDGMEPEDEL